MKKENLVSVPFMVLGIVFCVCLVAANLLETKVVQLGPISVTAGLIVFPISYIINDCIAEVWGFRKARLIIWRRKLQFRIRHGTSNCGSQSDSLFGRFVY